MRTFLAHSIINREHWAPHPRPPRGYFVSNLGNVRGPRGSALKTYSHGRGNYPRATINGKRRKVHPMVLEVFVGPRPDGMEACHYEDVASNDVLVNLHWGRQSANDLDRRRNHPPTNPDAASRTVLSRCGPVDSVAHTSANAAARSSGG